MKYAENCLDVNVCAHPDKVALIWERDDEKTQKITYMYVNFIVYLLVLC